MKEAEAVKMLTGLGYVVAPPPPPPDMDTLGVRDIDCPECLCPQNRPFNIVPTRHGYASARFRCPCGYCFSISARRIELMTDDEIKAREAVYAWIMNKR